jgi:ribosomal protein S18 acetylase RimI-like enzyme
MENESKRGEYTITTDRTRLDLGVVHGYLTKSYWAEGISRELVRRSIQQSLCFGLYHGPKQIGFARVVTDYTTYGYLGDVFVLEEYQGRGLGKWLIEVVMAHPQLQGFRRWSLLTRDAHLLYKAFGFKPLAHPERWMEKWDPEVYKRGAPR